MRGKAPATTHAFRLVSIRKQDQNMLKIKINKCNGNVTVAVTVASQPAPAAGSKPSGPAGGLCFPATGAHVVTLGDLLTASCRTKQHRLGSMFALLCVGCLRQTAASCAQGHLPHGMCRARRNHDTTHKYIRARHHVAKTDIKDSRTFLTQGQPHNIQG